MQTVEQTRDESGRLLGADGFPLGGMATVLEVVAVSRLAKSTIYKMIDEGDLPVRRFGRAVRIKWTDVRQLFLDDGE